MFPEVNIFQPPLGYRWRSSFTQPLPCVGVQAIMSSGEKQMSLESMLASLTPEEKLNAMDILWRDLSANPARLSSPDWHGDVLAHRIANPSSVPRLPIDAAFDDVRERLNARRTQG